MKRLFPSLKNCMLIKRKVLEDMTEHYPELKINQTTIINGKETTKPNFYNFFDTKIFF